MAFDIAGAKKAGYTDKELADYLNQNYKFDYFGAKKVGYSDLEINEHPLFKKDTVQSQPQIVNRIKELAPTSSRIINRLIPSPQLPFQGVEKLESLGQQVKATANIAAQQGIENLVTGESVLTPRPRFKSEVPIRAGLGAAAQAVAQLGIEGSPLTPSEFGLMAGGSLVGGAINKKLLDNIDEMADGMREAIGRFPKVEPVTGARGAPLMPRTAKTQFPEFGTTLKEHEILKPSETINKQIFDIAKEKIPILSTSNIPYDIQLSVRQIKDPMLRQEVINNTRKLPANLSRVEFWDKFRGIIRFKQIKPELQKSNILIPERLQGMPTSKELAMEKTDKLVAPEILKPLYAKPRIEAKPIEVFNPATQTKELQIPMSEQDVIPITPDKMLIVKRDYLDRFEPIKYAKGKGIAPEYKNAGGEYTKSYVGIRELSGKIKGIGGDLVDKYNDLLAPVKNFEERQIAQEIYLLRNYADLDKIGKTTSGITKEMAENRLTALRNKVGTEKFNRLNTVVDNMANLQNNEGLNILVEGKVITKEAAQALKEKYPTYLRSEILEGQLSQDYPLFLGTRGEPLSRLNKGFLKTKKGTDLLINEDVFDIIPRSLVSKVAVAEKQKVIDLIADDFGKIVGEQYYKAGKGIVTEVNPSLIPKGYVRSSIKTSEGKIFAVKKEIADMMDGLNTQEADLITKAITKYNNLFRVGATTYRLPFVITNIAVDVQTAIFQKRVVPSQTSQIGAYTKGFVSSLKGMLGMSDEMYEAWTKGGGGYGGLFTSARSGFSKELPFRLLSPKEKLIKGITKPVTIPFETVGKLAELSENTSRVAEFIRLQKTDIPNELKILNSRDITIDFEKMGEAMKILNKWIPFLNASVQGIVNTARAFKDQPITSMVRLGSVIIAPDVALKMYNLSFDNDKLIDPYIKANYFYLNTGMTVKRNNKDVPILGLIKKGALARQVTYPLENLIDYVSGTKDFKELLKTWSMRNIADGIIANFTPPIARGIAEQAANFDFFRGQKLISDKLRDVKPSYQFKGGTSNTARRLGELTGISPIRFEHALNSIFPASQQILETSDMFVKPKPLMPRNSNDLLQRTQAFQPVIRGVSGYYDPEEAKARQFLQEKQEQTRTPRFLFAEALKRYLDNKVPENLALVRKLAVNLTGKDRREIIEGTVKDYRISLLESSKRKAALKILPRKYRKEYFK